MHRINYAVKYDLTNIIYLISSLGNRIKRMENLSCLRSLTELNMRRNRIESIHEIDTLPALERLFVSHNNISWYVRVHVRMYMYTYICVYSFTYLCACFCLPALILSSLFYLPFLFHYSLILPPSYPLSCRPSLPLTLPPSYTPTNVISELAFQRLNLF